MITDKLWQETGINVFSKDSLITNVGSKLSHSEQYKNISETKLNYLQK